MAISFTIHKEYGLYVSSWVGSISDTDLISSYKDLFDDERYKLEYHEIIDTRNADMSDVTSEGLQSLASMVHKYLPRKCDHFKTAIIAPTDLSYGLSRTYQMFSEKPPEYVMVFREANKALQWLEIDNFHLD